MFLLSLQASDDYIEKEVLEETSVIVSFNIKYSKE